MGLKIRRMEIARCRGPQLHGFLSAVTTKGQAEVVKVSFGLPNCRPVCCCLARSLLWRSPVSPVLVTGGDLRIG